MIVIEDSEYSKLIHELIYNGTKFPGGKEIDYVLSRAMKVIVRFYSNSAPWHFKNTRRMRKIFNACGVKFTCELDDHHPFTAGPHRFQIEPLTYPS